MSEISVSVVGGTSINPTVGNGDVVTVTISETGERGPSGATGPAGPANTLTIGTVTQGVAGATLTGTAPNQVLSLVLPKGDTGAAVELQATSTHIQWRPVGGSTWANIVALSTLVGPAGPVGTPVELQATSTHIQWRYVGESSWTNVIGLSSLVGPAGPAGPAGPPINLSDETPQPLGTASAGTALAAARADHVHVVPTIAYGSLTGIPSTFAPSAHQHAVGDVTGLQTALDGKQAAGAYATLVNGQVPSAQLPSFVDDVVDVGGTLPASGEVGKIYVVSTGTNVNKTYRWSGSAFVEISPSPGSTDAVPEGSVNFYHTTARAAAAAPVQSVAGRTGAVTLTKTDVGLSNVPNTDATARANHTGTQTAATISDFATEAAKYGPVTSVNGQTGDVTVSGGSGSFVLPTASASVLGGVKIGSGLTITDGVLSASGGGSGGSLSASVTIPASGDQYWSNTLLLLKGDGNLNDSSGYGRVVTAYGGATTTTSSPKFGSGALSFDGASGSYMAIPSSSDFALSGSWTIEGWAYLDSTAAQYAGLVSSVSVETNPGGIIIASDKCFLSANNFGDANELSWTFPTNAWTHFAFVNDNGTLRSYLNGVQVTTASKTISITSTNLYLGCRFQNLQNFNWKGKADDLRISSVCRYPGGTTFTPPAATYPTGPYMAAQTLPVTITGSSGSGLSWSSVPASATATGTAGQISYDGEYFYAATAANTWRRAALSTWFNFTPSSISGLVGWFDASDASTLYDATSGGSAVAVNGSIARWADKSGAGNHALQATSASRPTRRSAGLNGRASVQFIADTADSGDWLRIEHASALNGSDGLAIFVVYSTASTGSNLGLLGKWDDPKGVAWIVAYTAANAGACVARHYTHNGTSATTQDTTSNFNDGAARLLGHVYTPSGGLQARMNGVLQGTNGSAVAPNANCTSAIVMSGYALADAVTGQRLMSSHISELLIYSASLTTQQVSDIEDYLMTKWGIT